MALIAVTSAKGAPGVSTAALALALGWPRPVLLVDADPAGGDLLAGFFRGEQLAGRGLLALTLEARRAAMVEQLWSQVLPLSDSGPAWLLPGVSDPRQVRAVDWQQLAAILPDLKQGEAAVDALADLGRLRAESEATRPESPGPEPLLRAADLVVLVLAGTLASVRAAQLRVAQLQALLADSLGGAGRLVGVLAGGGRPYGEREIAGELGIPVVAVLPRDVGTADILMAGAPARRGWRHAPLMRAAMTAGDLLVLLAEARHQAEAPSAVGRRSPASRAPAASSMSRAAGGWAPLPAAPAAPGGGHGR